MRGDCYIFCLFVLQAFPNSLKCWALLETLSLVCRHIAAPGALLLVCGGVLGGARAARDIIFSLIVKFLHGMYLPFSTKQKLKEQGAGRQWAPPLGVNIACLKGPHPFCAGLQVHTETSHKQ